MRGKSRQGAKETETRARRKAASPRAGAGRQSARAGLEQIAEQLEQIRLELEDLRDLRETLRALSDRLDSFISRAGMSQAGEQALGARDPGDAVPPGVAVQSPAPLSRKDRAVLRRLRRTGSSASTDESHGQEGGEQDEA